MNRKESFAAGEFYHVYNRGVDKRVVFIDTQDFDYFLTALELFNRKESLGGMPEYRYPKNLAALHVGKGKPLVNVNAFCLNPNHFHLVLQANYDNGIQKFMQKVSTGYTMYFNKKYLRSGALFQGRYKSSHIDSDQYLGHVLAYVALNNRVHSGIKSQNYRNCLEVVDKYKKAWSNSLVTDLFGSVKKFESFALDKLPLIEEQKERLKSLQVNLYLE